MYLCSYDGECVFNIVQLAALVSQRNNISLLSSSQSYARTARATRPLPEGHPTVTITILSTRRSGYPFTCQMCIPTRKKTETRMVWTSGTSRRRESSGRKSAKYPTVREGPSSTQTDFAGLTASGRTTTPRTSRTSGRRKAVFGCSAVPTRLERARKRQTFQLPRRQRKYRPEIRLKPQPYRLPAL